MWLWSLHTTCDTTLGMEGGQEECYCHSCSVFLSPPTLFRLLHFADRRPPGKNEGISMLVEFSVINPVCHATVLACLSLLHSIHPSILQSNHSHPSLSSPGWRIYCVKLTEKGSPWGRTQEQRSARPSVLMKS